MPPDFSKKTVDILAKRAAYRCSNPDCRISTVGPSSETDKATVIGEAAHILGARAGAPRFDHTMHDLARAEVTNAIWLCRNCHKQIDADERRFSASMLYAWREQHEGYVLDELGSATDRIYHEEQTTFLNQFEGYPDIVKRIVLDQPDGWEFRLTAELMRFLNKPLFRRMKDLRAGLYMKAYDHLDDDEVIPWMQDRLSEATALVNPLEGLIAKLNDSWGEPGESGDAEEIHHHTKLFRDCLEQVVEYEERVYFTGVPDKYKRLLDTLKELMVEHFEQIEEIPDCLDEWVTVIGTDHGGTDENPTVLTKTITLDVPDGWSKRFNRELNRLKYGNPVESSGCLIAMVIAVIFVMVLILA